jgi:predicted RNase H-like nuclease (RuvC/YqgF family)
MKFFLLLLLFLGVQTLRAQVKEYHVKDNNKTKQIEQLQRLKLEIARKADTLQAQLPQLAASLENTRKKIEQLKRENEAQTRPDPGAKDQFSAIAYELITATNQADSLRKKFDLRLNVLDQTLILQKDLEYKINALLKESNR